MTDRQFSLGAAALAAAMLIAAACTAHITIDAEPAARPPPPPTPAAPAPGQAVAVAPRAQVVSHLDAEAAEPGFNHCCGNDAYQLDIECGERLARCYERDDVAGWRQTYGRHCKEQLGNSCYLHGCSDKCEP